MDNVFYLSYYSIDKRNAFIAAQNKIDYIIECLLCKKHSVKIVSASIKDSDKKVLGENLQFNNGVFFKTFDSLPNGNVIKRFIRRKSVYSQLKKYLKQQIKEGDTILIYHSLGYYKLYKWIQKKIKAKVVLEIEEIYSDVGKTRFVTRKKEIKSFSFADAYVFPTELLNKAINVENKPSVIIHGTYKNEETCGKKFNDGKIHVVYAGTFDPRKGGAAAAAAGEFLSGDYHVHILGFGSEEDKKFLLKTIAETSKKTNCVITYDGLKSGKEYTEFIQSCDIGLSTQNPAAAFNATSFPSKILSYMANGLRVVSIKIPAVEQSAIGEYMYYYSEQTPKKIAEAIMQVDFNDGYDGKKVIENLDKKFVADFSVLLNVINKNDRIDFVK